jgi:hypothetical protein
MSTPRRPVIRLHQPPTDQRSQADRLVQKLRSCLESQRSMRTRWMTRLRRACHEIEKIERRITRIERLLARMEKSR